MDLRRASLALGAAFLGTAALLPMGCGASATSICDAICECVGCSDNDREECIDETEDAIDDAEKEGCGDQASALLDCWDQELECDDEVVQIDGCRSEQEDYSECYADGGAVGGGTLPGANPCSRLAQEAQAGGCAAEGGEEASRECSGDVAVASQCYLDAVSDVCQPTTEELTEYTECVSGGGSGPAPGGGPGGSGGEG
jgi:hypothetical protein